MDSACNRVLCDAHDARKRNIIANEYRVDIGKRIMRRRYSWLLCTILVLRHTKQQAHIVSPVSDSYLWTLSPDVLHNRSTGGNL